MKRLFGLGFLLLCLPTLTFGGDDAKDPTKWTPRKISGNHKIPEFEDVSDWINSPPITTAQLKGKVVVIHFLAFG